MGAHHDNRHYDLIVVGGGHAGLEAAHVAAKLGLSVLLITADITRIGEMSCNPSIGGIGKGQIVREIDALGGLTAKITDRTTLQFRMLNLSKGAAMHSPRAQCDRELYSYEWRKVTHKNKNIFLIQDVVVRIVVHNSNCIGVSTFCSGDYNSNSTILTAGTFLDGQIHIGLRHWPGGRIGEAAAVGLGAQLSELGLEARRFKTGTSARIDGRTIHYEELEQQTGDKITGQFAFYPQEPNTLPKLPCYITHTNSITHDILRAHLDQSPLYTHIIRGKGPRYCPSIEDKIRVFPDKESHQLFLEPESRYNNIVYVNGFSSSLPLGIQEESLHSVRGLEEAHIIRPGYAVEYTYFNPQQLLPTLESQVIENLYLAGQVNGTTGYEEAAGQGVVAGINAGLKITGKQALVLGRNQAYIGVMISDLLEQGTDEPYRMFTSRAEHRLELRQDNADERLMPLAHELGLIDDDVWESYQAKAEGICSWMEKLACSSVTQESANRLLADTGLPLARQGMKARDLLKRPGVSIRALLPLIGCEEIKNAHSGAQGNNHGDSTSHTFMDSILDGAEIRTKYADYILKESRENATIGSKEGLRIPDWIDYSQLQGISIEGREKLRKLRPRSVGEAKKIPGIKPSDILQLILRLERPSDGGLEK